MASCADYANMIMNDYNIHLFAMYLRYSMLVKHYIKVADSKQVYYNIQQAYKYLSYVNPALMLPNDSILSTIYARDIPGNTQEWLAQMILMRDSYAIKYGM